MNLIDFFDLNPKILSIAPTYKCTASCKHCCFRCTPKIPKILDTKKILNYIDEAVTNFTTIKGVVFTGGECFLIEKDLPLLIARANSYKLFTRIVSNAYWAKTYEIAIKRLSPMVESGLKEINFSTGDNHQKFVPLENVINAIKAAYKLGIRSICVSIETDPCYKFNKATDVIKTDPLLSSMIEEHSLFTINSAWMHFSRTDFINNPPLYSFQKHNISQPCENIFDNIFITPHSQLLSCCGLTVEYNKYLKIGNLENNSIMDLYKEQCNDLFKIWLHIEGPVAIYDKVTKIRGIEKKDFVHKCAYCLELVKDEENIKVIRDLIKKELPNIIYKYRINKQRFKL